MHRTKRTGIGPLEEDLRLNFGALGKEGRLGGLMGTDEIGSRGKEGVRRCTRRADELRILTLEVE